jgi:hypothetical protein
LTRPRTVAARPAIEAPQTVPLTEALLARKTSNAIERAAVVVATDDQPTTPAVDRTACLYL